MKHSVSYFTALAELLGHHHFIHKDVYMSELFSLLDHPFATPENDAVAEAFYHGGQYGSTLKTCFLDRQQGTFRN